MIWSILGIWVCTLAGAGTMAAEYTMRYADARRSSCIDGAATATGTVEWEQRLPYKKDKGTRIVLTDGEHLVAGGFDEYFIFAADGKPAAQGHYAPLSPVALHKNLLHFTGPQSGSTVTAVGFDGKAVIDNKPVPTMSAGTALPLFVPVDNGLVCHTFHRGPTGAVEQSIYLMHHGKLGYFDWVYFSEYADVPVPTIVCRMQKRLVATTPLLKAQVFDLEAKPGEDPRVAPLAEFDLPLGGSTGYVSAGTDGTLYWTGQDSASVLCAATDLDGKPLWQLSGIAGNLPMDAELIAPAIIISDKRQYLATKRNIYAIEGGTHIWTYSTPDFNFSFATGLSNGSVLLAKGTRILVIGSDGRVTLDMDLEAKIAAPPVIDNTGRIIAATDESLCAIR